MRATRSRRGQTLALFAITSILVLIMALMTISIGARAKEKLELQTLADAAAYSNAVATARTYNVASLLNRTMVSHWVALAGVQAVHAWGTESKGYFDAYASAIREFQIPRWRNPPPEGSDCVNVRTRPARTYPLQGPIWPETNGLRTPNYDDCPAFWNWPAVPTNEPAWCEEATKGIAAASVEFWHASLALWQPAPASDNTNGNCVVLTPFPYTDTSVQCRTPRPKPAQGWGPLDEDVTMQSKYYFNAIRNLGRIQRDTYGRLEEVLNSDELTRAMIAQSGLRNAADIRPANTVGARTVAWREAGEQGVTMGVAPTHDDAMARAAMGTRGSTFLVEDRTVPPIVLREVTAINNWMAAPAYVAANGGGLFRAFPPQGGGANHEGGQRIVVVSAHFSNLGGTVHDWCPRHWIVNGGDAADETWDLEYTRDRKSPLGFKSVVATAYDQGTPQDCNPRPHDQYEGKDRMVHVSFTVPPACRGRWGQVSGNWRTTGTGWVRHNWHERFIKLQLTSKDPRFEPGDPPSLIKLAKLPQHYWGHGPESSDHHGAGTAGRLCHNSHRHWREIDENRHTLGQVIDITHRDITNADRGLSERAADNYLLPGLGFVFPNSDLSTLMTRFTQPSDVGASGVWGQPKIPVMLTKAPSNVRAPWELDIRSLGFSPGSLDMGRAGHPSLNGMPMGSLSSAMTYYHRREHWGEAPNMLNPFWRATLVPVGIDERPAGAAANQDWSKRNAIVQGHPQYNWHPGVGMEPDAMRLMRVTPGGAEAATAYQQLVETGIMEGMK